MVSNSEGLAQVNRFGLNHGFMWGSSGGDSNYSAKECAGSDLTDLVA